MLPLDELRHVTEADVHKAGRQAGVLRRTAQGVVFRYVDDYLADPGPPVATTLPVRPDEVLTVAGAVPAFFAGLLPEGRRLTALRRAVKTSADDELSLLLAVGGDTVGDVQVVPSGEPVEEVDPRVSVGSFAAVRFADLFTAETGTPLDRVGLAGVQDKASARMIALPVARRAERFILKLQPPEFPHLVENEMAMLQAARLSGLAVVDAEVVHDADGAAALLVSRFDRSAAGAHAVEDGCQVLGRYPADKYVLTTEEVCAALARLTDAPVVAGRDLLRWVGFAYLSGNGDLHAKNLAIVQPWPGTWRLTPAFDLPASYPYGDHSMALSLNGKTREDIGRADLLALAAGLGVRERAADRVLRELADAVDEWLPLLRGLPFDGRLLHKWERAVAYRRSRLVPRGPSRPSR